MAKIRSGPAWMVRCTSMRSVVSLMSARCVVHAMHCATTRRGPEGLGQRGRGLRQVRLAATSPAVGARQSIRISRSGRPSRGMRRVPADPRWCAPIAIHRSRSASFSARSRPAATTDSREEPGTNVTPSTSATTQSPADTSTPPTRTGEPTEPGLSFVAPVNAIALENTGNPCASRAATSRTPPSSTNPDRPAASAAVVSTSPQYPRSSTQPTSTTSALPRRRFRHGHVHRQVVTRRAAHRVCRGSQLGSGPCGAEPAVRSQPSRLAQGRRAKLDQDRPDFVVGHSYLPILTRIRRDVAMVFTLGCVVVSLWRNGVVARVPRVLARAFAFSL